MESPARLVTVGGREFPNSDAWEQRARRVIPLATQTLSKSATQWISGAYPRFVQRAEGAHIWDVDGNEWVDFPMALGPVLLGYRDPDVDEAIREQMVSGYVFTLNHPIEVEVAERIVDIVPGVEAVRFAKSGSDAVSAAVRAARALTDREHVLTCGYHGWHNWYIGSTSRNAGVPKGVQDLISTFEYNDLDDLEERLAEREAQVAALVLEPSGAKRPENGFLQGVVDLAHQHGALAIFDEVITGFRLAPGGARERYDVQPDLSCYGKALGNGMPVSAVAGSWEVMRAFDDVFFSGTHGGETLSLAAARAVLDRIADGGILSEIAERGRRLYDAFAERVANHGVGERVKVGGEPQRTVVTFPGNETQITRSWVQQCMARRGVLFNGSMFICARHTDEDVDRAVEALDAALKVIASGADLEPLLVGPPLQPVFRSP